MGLIVFLILRYFFLFNRTKKRLAEDSRVWEEECEKENVARRLRLKTERAERRKERAEEQKWKKFFNDEAPFPGL